MLNQREGSFVRTKRYDTFGNYTRYITKDSRGMGTRRKSYRISVIYRTLKIKIHKSRTLLLAIFMF